ncbi:MAG: head-tail adaptor protein [Candidatus Dehalobacter alkaniphilus]
MFKPKEAANMTTPVKLQKRVTTKVSGAPEYSYVDVATDPILFCSFKTYGGTESTNNNLLTIVNTANVVTWYRPDITASNRIVLLQDGSSWEIIGEPENIEMRNQILMFKVRKISGGA